MATKKKLVPIKYTARDFNSIKDELKEYAKKYYPNTYQDFSEASFGALMLDSVAYVGDILSFYLDYQANESFLDSAIEYNNIIRLGKESGYKFMGSPTSQGEVVFYLLVPSNASALGPNTDYMPILKKGSSVSTSDGVSFILNEDVNFADPNNEVVVGRVDDDTGMPTYYAVKATGRVISGELAREEIAVGNFEKFLRVELSAKDIAEILAVYDDEGHQYYQVDYLSQNVLYRPVMNLDSSTNEQARNLMKPFIASRRFVAERERKKTHLQFGFGSDSEIESNSVADPTTVALQLYGKDYEGDSSLDPSRLLDTDKFGIAPANTALTVIFRLNTSDNVNASAKAVDTIVYPIFNFADVANLSSSEVAFIKSSLEVENEEPIIGDVNIPSGKELKVRIQGAHASQYRAVNLKDYEHVVYSMPPKYGAISRAAVYRDNGSFRNNLNLYIVSEDSEGNFIESNAALKENLKIWIAKSKMISDTIDILDARIINFGVEFEVIPRMDKNKFDVLSACYDALTEHFLNKKYVGEGINISEIYKVLNRIPAVADTTNVEMVLKSGGSYSDIRVSLDELISADGRFVSCPKNCIFEMKYPASDVKGATR